MKNQETNISSGLRSDLFTSPKELGNEVLVSLKYLSERCFNLMLKDITDYPSELVDYGYKRSEAKMIIDEADRIRNSRYPFAEDYSSSDRIKGEIGYLNPNAKIETAKLPIKKLSLVPENNRKVIADWEYDSKRNTKTALSLPLMGRVIAPFSIETWYPNQPPLEGSLLEYVYFVLDKAGGNQFKAKTNAAILLKKESKDRVDEKIRQLKMKTSTLYSFGLGDGDNGGKVAKHLGADGQSGGNAWDNLGIHNDQNEY